MLREAKFIFHLNNLLLFPCEWHQRDLLKMEKVLTVTTMNWGLSAFRVFCIASLYFNLGGRLPPPRIKPRVGQFTLLGFWFCGFYSHSALRTKREKKKKSIFTQRHLFAGCCLCFTHFLAVWKELMRHRSQADVCSCSRAFFFCLTQLQKDH